MNSNLSITAGLIVGLGLLLAGSPLNGQSSRAAAKGPTLVPQQQKFCQIILDGAHEVGRIVVQARTEQNPLRNDALQTQRYAAEDTMFDALYTLVGPSGEFTGWRGEASVSRPDGNGRMSIGFAFLSSLYGCAIREVLYFNMSTGDVPSQGNTDVLLSSPLGQTVANLDLSKAVTVSGTFLWVPKGGGYWPCHMHFIDRHHFMPGNCQPIPSLSDIRVTVRFTSIAQAR